MPTWGWLLVCLGCVMVGAAGLLVVALAVSAGAASREEERRHSCADRH